ncbi:hypothetical protein [Rhizobium mesosinicum]|uniref:Uncharacterized protein n=1 Tax=Rhizobium mesosinicum TaxID=335017 RepID=A0ABS7GU55_9HYPH|nr:hypothetical protein [Rhizobium mesosinicum]MBW9053483.1 hypothetical protein [Rhizobium mesosinicum]
MQIDINTKPIPENHKVALARPGANYRLFQDFVEDSIVGVELPGLFQPDEIVDINDAQLVARIQRSKEIRAWHNFGRHPERVPPQDLNEYDNAADDPSTGQLLRVLKFYLQEARAGDLVVVPPQNFGGKVHIGELLHGPAGAFPAIVQRYPGHPIVVRRVKWIGTLDKVDMPAKLIEAFRKPTPLLLIPSSERTVFYNAAYRNYYTPQRFSSTFDVTAPEFDTTSGSVIPAFFNFVAANTREVDQKTGLAHDFGAGAFLKLADYAPHLSINIQSPGTLSLVSGYITPLVASALLALALTVGPAASTDQFLNNLTVTNSAATVDDPCIVPVREQVVTHLRLLGYDKWSRACELMKEAADKTGLQSEATVKGD